MDKNIEIIVQITEQLRSSKQGRYLEKIADLCKTKHGWDLTTTKAAIDEAIEECAKDGGEEFFTEMHCVRITNL